MKLNDLIATLIKSSRQRTNVEGGLFMLTVEAKAMDFVRAELPNAHTPQFAERDTVRAMRVTSVNEMTDWPRVVVECHNPHIMLTNEADISVHVWKEGDTIKARCEKFRSTVSRPSDVWEFKEEAAA